MEFGVSTYLCHDEPLSHGHLAEIAALGFESVELFATRGHFDYHDPSAVEALGRWLKDTNLRLHGIHAPIAEGVRDGRWGAPFSNATPDPARRARAVRETQLALGIARHIETRLLVIHLGTPRGVGGTDDNNRDAALRSLEDIAASATPLGVRLALEVIPNDLSTPASLVHTLEEDVDLPGAGICLDFGHAYLMGDLVDAIETTSGHLTATHVHDNHGRQDEHLVPFTGTIDWPLALMTAQKIGYDGTFLLELDNTSTPRAVLEQARQACTRLEAILRT